MHKCHKQILLPSDEDEQFLTNFIYPIPKLSDPTVILCLFFGWNNHRRMRVPGKRGKKGNEGMQKVIGREKTEKTL